MKISYFILFGIVTITNGKPAADTYLVKNEHELEKLLRVLAKEGKYSSDSNQGNEQKDLQLINQIFANNVDKYPKLQNAQNLLEDVIMFRGNDNNEYTDDSVNGDIADLLNEIQRNLADDGSYVSELRCAGNRCHDKRVSADDRDDYRDEHYRNQPNLVCIGDTCTVPESAQSRYDDKEGKLKLNSKQLAKKVQISNDLDAVVLGMSDVDNLLSNFNAHKVQGVQKVTGTKLVENIDLDRLLNNQNIENKNANVEAVVFDLTNVENGDAVANEIKQVLSHDQNTPEEDYDEYGNLVQQHLKSGDYHIHKSVKSAEGTYKIMPLSDENNNVYLPQWLLHEVAPIDVNPLKYNLPLTKQQKKRRRDRKNKKRRSKQQPRKIFRRSFDQDVGVPFHLEIQGLGQVNP